LYIVVGENWWYKPGVGEQRKAETEEARTAHGGKDLLTAEDRAAGGGAPPEGLIARLIAVNPGEPDGPNLVLWVWESREHALAAGGLAKVLAERDVPELHRRVERWMDWSEAKLDEYEVIYFGHRDSGGAPM
jgi:hypothetical protein